MGGKKWLVSAIVASWFFSACDRRPDPGTPNVVLITLDTTRADYLGCYGHPEVKTPNIDRLADGGINFLNNVTPSQCTNPAHASILTGLYLAFHGVYDNQTSLDEGALTLAEILRDKGYRTLAAVSARHLNPENANFSQGFDEFLESDPVQLTAEERNQQFLKRLRKVARRSFFAWVHYYDPHGDYSPPAPYDSIYPVGKDFDPVPGAEWMDLSDEKKSGPVDPDEIIPLYKGEISFLDHYIGELLDLLEELGVTDRTLVILVADHGESMTEKGVYFCHAGLYNQVTHVPLIMRFPGTIPAGAEATGMTSSVDILPTVLDLLGFESPGEAIDGRNGNDWAVREDHLFRPFDDYGEENDLKLVEAERARRMESFLDTWLAEAKKGSLPSLRRDVLDQRTKEALETLGYIR
jgi:arylsulfatase